MLPKSRNARIISLVLGLTVLISGTLLVLAQDSRTRVNLGGQTFYVSVADTPAELQQGLSGTSSLEPNEGMLFDFGADNYHGIWMKDMNYPIDVIWLDANKQVITVAQNVSPDTYPQTFGPDSPSRYVIELPAGAASQHGITNGAVAEF